MKNNSNAAVVSAAAAAAAAVAINAVAINAVAGAADAVTDSNGRQLFDVNGNQITRIGQTITRSQVQETFDRYLNKFPLRDFEAGQITETTLLQETLKRLQDTNTFYQTAKGVTPSFLLDPNGGGVVNGNKILGSGTILSPIPATCAEGKTLNTTNAGLAIALAQQAQSKASQLGFNAEDSVLFKGYIDNAKECEQALEAAKTIPTNPAITPTPLQPVQPVQLSTNISRPLLGARAVICDTSFDAESEDFNTELAGNNRDGSLAIRVGASRTRYSKETTESIRAVGSMRTDMAAVVSVAKDRFLAGDKAGANEAVKFAGTINKEALACPEAEPATTTILTTPPKEGQGGAGKIAEPTTPSNKIPVEPSPVPNNAAVPDGLRAFKEANMGR